MTEGLFTGCACAEDAADIAVIPDELRRFASSRSLGLGFSHVRDVVGALSGLSRELKAACLHLFAVGQFLHFASPQLASL